MLQLVAKTSIGKVHLAPWPYKLSLLTLLVGKYCFKFTAGDLINDYFWDE